MHVLITLFSSILHILFTSVYSLFIYSHFDCGYCHSIKLYWNSFDESYHKVFTSVTIDCSDLTDACTRECFTDLYITKNINTHIQLNSLKMMMVMAYTCIHSCDNYLFPVAGQVSFRCCFRWWWFLGARASHMHTGSVFYQWHIIFRSSPEKNIIIQRKTKQRMLNENNSNNNNNRNFTRTPFMIHINALTNFIRWPNNAAGVYSAHTKYSENKRNTTQQNINKMNEQEGKEK